MAAWQTFECQNFRDVGEALDNLQQAERSKWIFPKNSIMRGGEIDMVCPEKIRHPKYVINLRNVHDDQTVPLFTEHQACYHQTALGKDIEKYHTQQPVVRQWLEDILLLIQNLDSPNKLPVFIHCRFGRDRTGIVVAAILAACGFSREIIFDEFMLSSEAKTEDINACLDPIFRTAPSKFFRKVDCAKLRATLGVSLNQAYNQQQR